ncbi:BPSL0761 family protein [Frateuria sp. GZRR33]|uniref:BPSL0761 family protein n=1 Tax=Frateuria sp. GZRR33 TaxID=3351535 RepID=UPI003EDCA370
MEGKHQQIQCNAPSRRPRMTMPDERTRSMLQAGAFLKELSMHPRVPAAIREEARRLARHYPTESTLRLLASLAGGSNILTPNIDPAWLEQYAPGAPTN